MKEKPILFSGAMILALLAGKKTQTRRVLKPQQDTHSRYGNAIWMENYHGLLIKCPYGNPGDRLWVREKFSGPYYMTGTKPSNWPETVGHIISHPQIWYWADGDPHKGDWTLPKPSIHMPRWASRIDLMITRIRVERLMNITKTDAIAEGLTSVTKDGKLYKWGIPDRDGLPGSDDYGWDWKHWDADPRYAYMHLWESINGQDSWKENPWVWVVDFAVVPHLCILHVVRHLEPDTIECDTLNQAVICGLEGVYECQFSIQRITDSRGITILADADAIIEYAHQHNL